LSQNDQKSYKKYIVFEGSYNTFFTIITRYV